MSRIGKKPISIPVKTTVSIDGALITVKGAKGTLARDLHPNVDVAVEGDFIVVRPRDPGRETRALHGLTRALVANMVTGVSQGFERILEVNGIGYKAEVSGTTLSLALGFSHPIQFPLPDGISATVDKKNAITLTGIDKELLGQTASAIRRLRPPEPYKGKGIKYSTEKIMRKAGKTGGKGK
ncbi:MAG: 50S ribosomal protein L6 [Deltaproteobacteria bacterium]|nr:50S ribosomal protein L6 [Deltaproteobacteria bacterium]